MKNGMHRMGLQHILLFFALIIEVDNISNGSETMTWELQCNVQNQYLR